MISNRVLELASEQHGVVSRHQLTTRFDLPGWKVARTLRNGIFVEVVPGVLRLASSPETFMMRCAALQLRFRGNGFLSGWTAARIRGLRKMPEGTIHFTTPSNTSQLWPEWLEIHRTGWYEPRLDQERHNDGLIVATPMRMLFGLAAAFNQFRFERAAEDAWHRKLITPQEAANYLQQHRCRGKDGVSTIERWLEKALTQGAPAQSGLEQSLLDSLDGLSLPSPIRQHPLTLPSGETVHLDIAWPDIRLAIEPGSSWWHGGDLAQRKDQARDRSCGEQGWHIIRFDETMRDDLHESAQQVVRIYRRRTRDIRNLL